MASIKSIHIEGFRSLENVTLEPGRITVMIGPNGAGKSNVLGALRLLSQMRRQLLRVTVGMAGGASPMLHYGASKTPEIKLELRFEDSGGWFGYVARLGSTADDGLVFLEEALDNHEPTGVIRLPLGAGHRETLINDEAGNGSTQLARSIRLGLERMRSFHFHDTSDTAPLRLNSRQEDVRGLNPNGGNLAAYLYLLANGTSDEYRVAWERINMLVRRVAPFIQQLAPTLIIPDQADRSAVRLDWIDATGEIFAAHQLSDGTLRAIALFTALGQPIDSLPAFITIDEPELGLHPRAISLLAGLVHSVSSHCQILIATQSPALLDEFHPADVVIVGRRDNATVLERLEPDKLEVWREDYSLSEIWDKNIIGGNP